MCLRLSYRQLTNVPIHISLPSCCHAMGTSLLLYDFVTENQWSQSSTWILNRSCLLNRGLFSNWILRESAIFEDFSKIMLNIWIPVGVVIWCSAVASDLSEMRDFL